MADYGPSGALFRETNKKNEKAPDYTGTLELDKETVDDIISQASSGVPKIRIAGWVRESRAGLSFLSVRANPLVWKGEKTERRAQRSDPLTISEQANKDFDDEIPF